MQLVAKFQILLCWVPRGWQTKGFLYGSKPSQAPNSTTNKSWQYPSQQPKMAKFGKKVQLVAIVYNLLCWVPQGWQTKGFLYGNKPSQAPDLTTNKSWHFPSQQTKMAKIWKKVQLVAKIQSLLHWYAQGWQTKGFSYGNKPSQAPNLTTNKSKFNLLY